MGYFVQACLGSVAVGCIGLYVSQHMVTVLGGPEMHVLARIVLTATGMGSLMLMIYGVGLLAWAGIFRLAGVR